MKLVRVLLLLTGWLGALGTLQAQRYDTPPFNFDRSLDQHYVDSLLRATRLRLLNLNRFRQTPTVDTARMELLHFIAYVHYSGKTHRDSSLMLANQLIQLAQRHRNIKYQIKGLLLTERYYRAVKGNYPQAIRLNYRLLSLVESTPDRYGLYVWRIYRNLGNISLSIGEPDEAVTYFGKSVAWFDRDNPDDLLNLADLHQSLGNACVELQRYDRAESHFLRSWKVLNRAKAPASNKAYLTNDLGRLYNLQQKPAQAVPYLKQAVAYWQRMGANLPESDALADLAEAYLSLRQYDEAIAAARQALDKNKKVHVTILTAFSVLVRAYEQQRQWESAFRYQQIYNEKKVEQQQAINQVESLRQKAIFEQRRLQTIHQQERLLQQQRYQTLAKQAEIDRLNGVHQTAELRRRAQTSALRHQLEKQQLRAAAIEKQASQQATIKQLKIDQLRLGLSAQTKVRNLLFAGLTLISLMGLLLLYYSLRLRRTNRALVAKNQEIEMALVRGQTLERKRVAVELHDRVGSLLGATKMTFQTIDAESLPPRDRKLYKNSLDLLNDAATQIRELSHNLMPDQLLQQDLPTLLRNLVEKLNLTGQTTFSLYCETLGPVLLSPDAKFNLYVICLELCTNILRHAQAKRARVRVLRRGDGLTLEVADDGMGVELPARPGMGLHNIRQRAAAIGGVFSVEPGRPAGTRASVWLPLTTSSAFD